MYFDTHAHYDDEAFRLDRMEVLEAARSAGVELILNASSGYESSLASLELAGSLPYVYAAVGWHPHEAKHFDQASPERIKEWAALPKVAAIGEIGLDYYYDHSEREVQKEVFRRQLQLAGELGLPVIVHDRDAHGDCLEIVDGFPEVTGVFHCFSGSPEMAEQLIKRGWYLGFGGAITFKNAKKAPEVVKLCPNDRFLLETDCPYLTPSPHRGKRNDSSYLTFITEKLAEFKGISPLEAARLGLENGLRLFDISR